MVSRKALLIAAAAAMAVVVGALLLATASAWPTNHVVGDLQCWTLGVDYDQWALSVSVHADDTLEFVYTPGVFNVVMVNEDGYNPCDATNNLGMWNSGDDKVQLSELRQYFFICSTGDHCSLGMKLAITVEA